VGAASAFQESVASFTIASPGINPDKARETILMAMPNHALRRGISFYLLYSLLLFPCAAQQSVLNDWQQVRNLSPQTDITVQTKAGERYNGRLLIVAADSLTLDSDERGHPGRIRIRRDVPKDAIRRVRLLHPGVSILAGAGIGAAVGAGIGLTIDLSARSHEDGKLATFLFTLLGAALGAGIGRHFPIVKGKTIYLAR
jgi:hypothetical protein